MRGYQVRCVHQTLFWFQRRFPPYACKFLEMCLMIIADQGPAVSGAHNTIVCARVGKDLVNSLVSGLLTSLDRFGGALDGAARQFTEALDSELIANDYQGQEGGCLDHGHRAQGEEHQQPRQEGHSHQRVCQAELPHHTPLGLRKGG